MAGKKKSRYENEYNEYESTRDGGVYRADEFDWDAPQQDPFGSDPYGEDEYERGYRDGRDAYERGYRDGRDAYERGYRASRAGRRRGQVKKKKKHRVGLFIFEILLLILLGLGVFLFSRLGKIDHQKLGELIFNDGARMRGYRNVVIYGVDSREGELTKDCHSDTIMIASLNQSSKEVRLVSVYRDTYLDNTNGEYRKATECYFFGGPERSVNMLNKNLDLDISDYIAVNFNAVVKIVDMLGGIDLEITDEERELINGYCVENEQVTGASYTPLESAGYVHLTGTQALAYCRIRYTEGWDFKRTERQRTVLSLAYQKAAAQGRTTLLSMVNAMLPEISTSMGSTELLALAGGITGYTMGEQTGFPFNQTPADLSDAGDCVVPVNLADNVRALHEFLYGPTDYTPSQTVQEISDTISANTGIY